MLPGAEEFGDGDVWKACELRCQDARGVLGGSLGEAGDCGGVEWQRVDVGAIGIGIFAVGGGVQAGEVYKHVP